MKRRWASTYLRAAEFFFPASRPEERRKLYEESVAQFDAATKLMPYPVEKVAIPYEGGVTLPGRAMIENYLMWNHGASGLAEVVTRVRAFTLEGLEERIVCPTLSLVAEGETDVATEQAPAHLGHRL